MAEDSQRVVITDIKIPFWSMVVLIIKWAIAALPAFFIIAMAWFVSAAFFAAIFGWPY